MFCGEDGLTKSFLIFHKFIVCQICQIQLPLNKDISSTIQQHLRQYEHQERIHTLCLKSLIIKESFFDLEQAQKCFQKQNNLFNKEILKNFETELFNDKELSKHTKQNYISTMKDYYHQLFIQPRNIVTENELKMEISNQRINIINRSLNNFHYKQIVILLALEWKNIYDLQNGLQSQLQQEQKNFKIIGQDWFQDNYMKNLITTLKESGYKRLSIALYLLYETNLNGDEIALLFFAQLKQGDYEALNNLFNKRFNIDEDQWLKDSKQILSFKQEDKNSNFIYFVVKLLYIIQIVYRTNYWNQEKIELIFLKNEGYRLINQC